MFRISVSEFLAWPSYAQAMDGRQGWVELAGGWRWALILALTNCRDADSWQTLNAFSMEKRGRLPAVCGAGADKGVRPNRSDEHPGSNNSLEFGARPGFKCQVYALLVV